jgi:hypothetical protein
MKTDCLDQYHDFTERQGHWTSRHEPSLRRCVRKARRVRILAVVALVILAIVAWQTFMPRPDPIQEAISVLDADRAKWLAERGK